MIEEKQEELKPTGCSFWWFSLLARFYRPPKIGGWNELKAQGWYWYYNRETNHEGYVLSNGIEKTEPLKVNTLEEFLYARERYAEKILEEQLENG